MLLSEFLLPYSDHLVMILLVSFVVMMVLDFVSGIAKALSEHEFSSTKMREGILHKSSLIIVIVTFGILQTCLNAGASFGFDIPALDIIITLLMVMELSSVFENVCEMSPTLANSKIGELLMKKTGDSSSNEM